MKTYGRLTIMLTGGALLLSSALVGCGCGTSENSSSPHHYEPREKIEINQKHDGKYPITVVCTTGMIADIVKNVCKNEEHVKVVQLMKAGTDPHTYKVRSDDERKLRTANLIFYNGLHLEGKLHDVLESYGRKKNAIPVAEYFAKEKLRQSPQGVDPHVWFDVELWNEVREVVQKTMYKYDPSHSDDYKKWGDAYKKQLEDLHNELVFDLDNSLPKEKRILVTAHDAFGYFGKKYGFTVKGIQGISTDGEPDLAHITELINYIVKNKVQAVFVESTVNQRKMKALIEGCVQAGHKVANGGELFSDAMDEPGKRAGTYIGMMRYNVETIIAGLKAKE